MHTHRKLAIAVTVMLSSCSSALGTVIYSDGYTHTEAQYWSDSETGYGLDYHESSDTPFSGSYQTLLSHSDYGFAPWEGGTGWIEARVLNEGSFFPPGDSGFAQSAHIAMELIPGNVSGIHMRGSATFELSFTLTEPTYTNVNAHIGPGLGLVDDFSTNLIMLLDQKSSNTLLRLDEFDGKGYTGYLSPGTYLLKTILSLDTPQYLFVDRSADIRLDTEVGFGSAPEPVLSGLVLLFTAYYPSRRRLT